MNYRFHTRGFTSFSTLLLFLIMSITGIVLYIVPEGRIANWTDWRLLGLTKSDWGDIHILASLLFVVSGSFHTYFNWPTLISYLKNRATEGIRLKWELALSVFIAIAVIVSAISNVPPLSTLIAINNAIKQSWIQDKNDEPPFGHAEDLSLGVLCKKLGIPWDSASDVLLAAGLTQLDQGIKLSQLATVNKRSPMDIYLMIRHLEPQSEASPGMTHAFTAAEIEDRFGGTGIGNKSLADISPTVGVPVELMLARLEKSGYRVSVEESIKAASSRLQITPLELLKAALVDAVRPMNP
jgi:hypothetical protein